MYKNNVEIIGKLFKAEYFQKENGKNYWRAVVSVSYKTNDDQWNNQYFSVTAFSFVANHARKLHEKDYVLIDGKLNQSSYEKDGETKYSTSIIANRVLKVTSPYAKQNNETSEDYVKAKNGEYDDNDFIDDDLHGEGA